MLTKEQYKKILEVGKITGYGLMDARKALELSNWDIVKAVSFIQENGSFSLPHPNYLKEFYNEINKINTKEKEED